MKRFLSSTVMAMLVFGLFYCLSPPTGQAMAPDTGELIQPSTSTPTATVDAPVQLDEPAHFSAQLPSVTTETRAFDFETARGSPLLLPSTRAGPPARWASKAVLNTTVTTAGLNLAGTYLNTPTSSANDAVADVTREVRRSKFPTSNSGIIIDNAVTTIGLNLAGAIDVWNFTPKRAPRTTAATTLHEVGRKFPTSAWRSTA